ncbi:hypothetical protein B0J13DRAFT_635929 [Dactylonectria estremocensis]|uniref:Uncharacterized protein n=1 Tax=Dactylonectria estremocensis TaxID=1079267 RepID=A0A9P9EUF7_9HYPO|nr:hypothetical protein B0J13DRAFT_635929 [Dactylonectria estremocensis]
MQQPTTTTKATGAGGRSTVIFRTVPGWRKYWRPHHVCPMLPSNQPARQVRNRSHISQEACRVADPHILNNQSEAPTRGPRSHTGRRRLEPASNERDRGGDGTEWMALQWDDATMGRGSEGARGCADAGRRTGMNNRGQGVNDLAHCWASGNTMTKINKVSQASQRAGGGWWRTGLSNVSANNLHCAVLVNPLLIWSRPRSGVIGTGSLGKDGYPITAWMSPRPKGVRASKQQQAFDEGIKLVVATPNCSHQEPRPLGGKGRRQCGGKPPAQFHQEAIEPASPLERLVRQMLDSSRELEGTGGPSGPRPSIDSAGLRRPQLFGLDVAPEL